MQHCNNVRHISAHYLISGQEIFKRAVVTVDKDGFVIGVDDRLLPESRAVEFYNGILIPGLFNCHCHLELSGLKSTIPEKCSLPDFLTAMRHNALKHNIQAIINADRDMYDNGIVFCADTCNSLDSFDVKRTGRLQYYNIIEVFGSLPSVADDRLKNAKRLVEQSLEVGVNCSISPHSAYSVSLLLLNHIRQSGDETGISSIHFMESAAERQYLTDMIGGLATSFADDGLLPAREAIPFNHVQAVNEGVKSHNHLVLVHNTFVDVETVRQLVERGNVWWCLCPNSNLFIENCLPPVEMLMAERASIVIGTDSLASNYQLSILEEMKTLQRNFPDIDLQTLVLWATKNGADAFNVAGSFGTIEPGKKPGLMLLENLDIRGKRFAKETTIRRLV